MQHPAVIPNFTGEYRWLSNFWLCNVVHDGSAYPSSEHAYQAAKTLNRAMRDKIAMVGSPGMAKKMGQYVEKRPDWDDMKVQVMTEIIRAKFFQNEELRKWLIATGNAEIIEGNSWRDRFWGVYNGVGQNHLGKILMQVRQEAQVNL